MNNDVPDTHSKPRTNKTDSTGNAYGSEGNIVDTETGEIISRAFENPQQAWECAKRLLLRNRGRNEKLAAIMDKYDDSPPWSPGKLKESGQGWRNNCPTGFLSSLIRRGIIPYQQLVNNAKYITFATLDGDDPGLRDKERKFREETTRTVRGWPEYPTFKEEIILDNFIGGYVFACHMDEWEWRPRHFRQDDAMVPDGAGQTATQIPILVLRVSWMPHELTDVTVYHETAEQVGWNWKNVAAAINDAQPVKALVTTGDEAKLQDLSRETSMGRSYTEGVRVVETYMIFVQEPNGKVSSYLTRQKDGLELRTVLDQFESMSQVVTVFTLESGNSKVHGSKGAGRLLYNDHVSVEHNRNIFRDNVYLAGLILLQGDGTSKSRQKVGITVAQPVGLLPDGYKVVENPIQADVQDHILLDNHLTKLAETKMSIITPNQFQDANGDKATASEVNYVATIEAQIKDGFLARFWNQYMALMSEVQRRIYLPENIREAERRLKESQSLAKRFFPQKVYDFMRKMQMNLSNYAIARVDQSLDEDAVRCCLRLLRAGLTATEIYELATSPAWPLTDEATANDSQKLAQLYAQFKGDPDVDQNLLKRTIMIDAMGPEFTNRALPENYAQTQVVEAVQAQMAELASIMALASDIPVSPRDLDVPHMDTIMNMVGKHFQEIHQAPAQSFPILKAALDHFDAHLQGAQGKGMAPEALFQYKDFSKLAHKLMDQGPAPEPQPPQIPQGTIPANGMPDMSQPEVNSGQSMVLPDSGLEAAMNKPLSRGPKMQTTAQGPIVQSQL